MSTVPVSPTTLSKDAPLTQEALRQYFIEGAKSADNLQIGVEWEKIGVDRQTGRAIPYSGPRGVEAIFSGLIARYGWSAIFSDRHVIALRKGAASITLEPGGQIELSGQKACALKKNAAELHTHLCQINNVSEPLGIVWLGTGMQPVSSLDQIEWAPKERYVIMRESLKSKGALTHAMMKQTASIQVSLDYVSEADAVEKFRLAMALAPFFAAIYANSPVSDGRPNGFLSKRSAVWLETATDRSGSVEAAFRDDFSFAKYVEYALGVPALFIVRQGQWVALNDMTFGDFIEKGHKEYRATLADWELHLSTIFTDVRLKRYIEIRTIDCQKTALGLSVPALVKGLFYDEEARRRAWMLVKGASAAERRALALEIPKKALQARFQSGTILDIARELVRISGEALRRGAALNPKLNEDPGYLAPLEELILQKGKCPAELLVERFGDWGAQETVRRMIDDTALVTAKNEVCNPS